MTASTDLANLVTQEVLKVLRGKRLLEVENKVNFAHIRQYAGIRLFTFSCIRSCETRNLNY